MILHGASTQIHSADAKDGRNSSPLVIAESGSMITVLHDILPVTHNSTPALTEISLSGNAFVKGHLKNQILSLGFVMPKLV